jgi:hypothetical protein
MRAINTIYDRTRLSVQTTVAVLTYLGNAGRIVWLAERESRGFCQRSISTILAENNLSMASRDLEVGERSGNAHAQR